VFFFIHYNVTLRENWEKARDADEIQNSFGACCALAGSVVAATSICGIYIKLLVVCIDACLCTPCSETCRELEREKEFQQAEAGWQDIWVYRDVDSISASRTRKSFCITARRCHSDVNGKQQDLIIDAIRRVLNWYLDNSRYSVLKNEMPRLWSSKISLPSDISRAFYSDIFRRKRDYFVSVRDIIKWLYLNHIALNVKSLAHRYLSLWKEILLCVINIKASFVHVRYIGQPFIFYTKQIWIA